MYVKKNVYTSGFWGQNDPTLKWMGNLKKLHIFSSCVKKIIIIHH